MGIACLGGKYRVLRKSLLLKICIIFCENASLCFLWKNKFLMEASNDLILKGIKVLTLLVLSVLCTGEEESLMFVRKRFLQILECFGYLQLQVSNEN